MSDATKLESSSALPATVRLDRALELLIFTGAPLHISFGPRMRLSAQVVDVAPDSMSIEIDDEKASRFSDRLRVSASVEVTFGYKGQCAGFASSITHIVPADAKSTVKARVVLTRPAKAELSTQRRHPRTSLASAELNLRADLVVTSAANHKSLSTTLLHDISHDAVAVFLSRENGTVLPDDDIESLTIYRDGKLILSTRGKVMRIDTTKTSQNNRDTYLAVLAFDAAGSRSNVVELGDSRNRRRAARVCFIDEKSAFVSVPHPMVPGSNLSGQIVDISTSGVSFFLAGCKYPVLPGMVLDDLSIQLPMKPRFQTAAKVTFCQSVGEGDGQIFRVGAEFSGMSVGLLKAINESLQVSQNPNLVDATTEDYEQLWEFFFETGFLYREKRQQLQDYAPKLMRTYSRLLQANNNLLKKIVYKEQGQIKGHISALRFFDQTWVVQHLNALKAEGVSAAEEVLGGITDFFLDPVANRKSSTAYMVCYFRPDNGYPAILFGETRNIINNEKICSIEELQFCLPKETPEKAEPVPSDILVHEASRDDLLKLEDVLIEQGRFQLMRAEGLTTQGMQSLQVASEYEALGLYRSRRIFVAESAGSAATAYAVCNYASAGLNLSELTNSIRIYFSESSEERNRALLEPLMAAVIESYSATDIKTPVLLLSQGQSVPAGYEVKKTYSYWILDGMHVDKFRDASNHIFANMKQYLRKYLGNGRGTDRS